MANIEINNLHPVGSELFQDSESFLNELTDREMWGVQGGITAASSAVTGEFSGITGEVTAELTSIELPISLSI